MAVLEQIIFKAIPHTEDPVLAGARKNIQDGDVDNAISNLAPYLADSTFDFEGVDFTRSHSDEAQLLTYVATYKKQVKENLPDQAITTIQDAKAFVDLNMPQREDTLTTLLTIEEAGIWKEQGIQPRAREILASVPDRAAGGEKVYLIAEMDFDDGNYVKSAEGFERVYRMNPQRSRIKDRVIGAYRVLADPNVTPALDGSFDGVKPKIIDNYSQAETKFNHGAVKEALKMFADVKRQLGGRFYDPRRIAPKADAEKAMEAKILHWNALASITKRLPQTALQQLKRANQTVESPHAYSLMADVYQNMK